MFSELRNLLMLSLTLKKKAEPLLYHRTFLILSFSYTIPDSRGQKDAQATNESKCVLKPMEARSTFLAGGAIILTLQSDRYLLEPGLAHAGSISPRNRRRLLKCPTSMSERFRAPSTCVMPAATRLRLTSARRSCLSLPCTGIRLLAGSSCQCS